MKLKLWGVWLVAGLLAGCSGSAPEKEAQVSEAGQTRLQLGLEYLQQGDMDAARQNLEKALDAAPQDYRTQLGMALYEQRIGENAAAEQRYRQALKLAPGNGTVLNNYGAFLCGLGSMYRRNSSLALRRWRPIMVRSPTAWKTQVTVFSRPDKTMKRARC